MDGQRDVRNGSPLCPTGHRPFGAAALLSLHFTWSLKAGHRLPLTMCDPWMSCYFFIVFERFELTAHAQIPQWPSLSLPMTITLIASPTYVKSRHCDQFLMFLCKNVTKRAHAQLSNRSDTFFRVRLKMRRLNVKEALFRKDDYCSCSVYSPTILHCLEDFFSL